MHRTVLLVAVTAAALGAVACSDSTAGTAGTATVFGTVVEEQTFTPVGDATIQVAGLTTRTDAAGAFRVAGVTPGSCALTVTATGFLTHERTVEVTPGDNDIGQLWLKRGTVPDGGRPSDGGALDAATADGGTPDAPAPDAAPTDAGQADARPDGPPLDARQQDAPPQVDAGQSDGPCQTGYHRCATGCCAWVLTDLEPMGGGEYASLKLDSSGRPHLAWGDDATPRVRYAWWTGSGWSYETVASAKGLYVSLALDSANRPRVVWVDASDESLHFASRVTGSWSGTTVDNKASFCSVNVDGAGVVHVGYRESQNQYLKHATSSNETSFAVENVDTVGNPGWYASMDVSAAGAVHFVYFTDQTELRYARKETSAVGWSKQVIDAVPYGVGASSTSISLDASGVPHVAYREYGSPSRLKYAVRSGGTWQITVLQDYYELGSVALAVGPVGAPQVVAWNHLDANLEWAEVGGAFQVLDDNKRPGLYGRAIAVDAVGGPHIVYTTHTTPRQVGYAH